MDLNTVVTAAVGIVGVCVAYWQLRLAARVTRLEEERAIEGKRANVIARVEREPPHSHRLVVENPGPASAHDVNLTIESTGRSPLIAEDQAAKFPAAELPPGGRISVLAISSFGMPPTFTAILSWSDGTGARSYRFPLNF